MHAVDARDRLHDPSHDPFFTAVTAEAFTRELLADLAAARCVAVQVPGFLPPDECAGILRALERTRFVSYGAERVSPVVMRFGVGVSDHRRDGVVDDAYWDALELSRRAWDDLALPYDPFERCRDHLATHWPQGVAVGRRGGREMGAGVAREPNYGFQVHFDDARREFAGNLLDAPVVAQFAFNLYLSVPTAGGETVMWRHRWEPRDEAHRLPGSYGYDQAVVGDAESLEITPSVGTALLINSRFFHAVRAGRGARRIALGFSVGMADTGRLMTWG